MRRKIRPLACWMGLALALLSWHCPTPTKQVRTQKQNSPQIKAKASKGGCISGRVLRRVAGKWVAFPGVKISTQPATALQISDSNGIFVICSKRKVVNKELGETRQFPIPPGNYTITFQQQGYKARPQTVHFQGQNVTLPHKARMVEQGKPLPNVQDSRVSKTKDPKEPVKTKGAWGKNPSQG